MTQTLLDFRRSAFLNSLLFVRALSVEAVGVLSIISFIGLKPAEANTPHIPVPEPPVAGRYYQSTRSYAPQSSRSSQAETWGNQQNSSFSATRERANFSATDTTVATVINPSKRSIPQLPRSHKPVHSHEDELIEQMSGRGTVVPATRTAAASPAFVPPPYRSSVAAAPIRRQSAWNSTVAGSGTTDNRGILTAAKSDSDVGLGLLAPTRNSEGGCRNGRNCYYVQPTAQYPATTTPDYTITQPGLPTVPGAAPATDPRGNPLEDRVNPPSSLPSERIPTRQATALNSPALQLQGVYLNQADQSSARARVSGVYPLTPNLLFGATVDLTNGNAFSDSREQGLNLNELYLASSFPDLPNLRFVVGKLDLTSYFDRNSFAKDASTHFFNPVFQTNPALSTTGISSRIGGLVNWSVTDNIEAKAAIFSSARRPGDFSVDGFAGEVGVRYGNAIIRGTYVSDRDAGVQDGFREIYQLPRGNGQTGLLRADREESYGINGEVYIPNVKMGVFGRYGRYQNSALALGGDTYSIGFNFLDLFAPDDRLGIAYGRDLSNNKLRIQRGDKRPDVLELFYDFRLLPNLRLGLSVQERNNFSETILGFRVKTELNVTSTDRRNQ